MSRSPAQSKSAGDLAARCQTYLDAGPPAHMTAYVPESISEIIIAHGAQDRDLDPELQELAGLVAMEAEGFDSYEDAAIRDYLTRGAKLVEEVLEEHSG